MTMKPIRPNEVADALARTLADDIVDAFNQEIVNSFDSDGVSVVSQKTIEQRLAGSRVHTEIQREWFTVVRIYRSAGWSVHCTGGEHDRVFTFSNAFSKDR
jgi:hypothetical protein